MRGVDYRCAAIALLAAAGLGGVPARAQEDAATQGTVIVAPDRPPSELNPAGRAVTLTAPMMDGEAYLGDATITLGAEGSVSFSAARLLALLTPRLRPELGDTLSRHLAERGRLERADLEQVGVGIRYDPQTLEIELTIAAANGVMLGALIGTGTFLIFHNANLAIVIGMAMVINNIVAGLSGVLVPVGLERSGVDPAVSSAVFVTMMTDVMGFFSFLGLATLWGLGG